MIKVGSMVQSKYRLSSGKEGNLGLVMEMRNTEEEAFGLAHVYYPKTRTFGWVVAKDMKVVA
tara:strand:- start:23 stop:208 length:186 start_codon:yes stop_codon:yes gene_type:complete